MSKSKSKQVKPPETGLKYVGQAVIDGIPARDLSPLEVSIFGRDRLIRSGLYAEANGTTKESD